MPLLADEEALSEPSSNGCNGTKHTDVPQRLCVQKGT